MRNAPKSTVLPWLRLMSASGWPAATAGRRGVPNDGGPIRLGNAGAAPIAMNEPFGSFGGQRLPRGMAVGPEGRVFLCDTAAGVVFWAFAAECRAKGNAAFRPLWERRAAPDAYALDGPTDVHFTCDGKLVICDRGRVLVLDWPTMAIRQVLKVNGWRPVALAAERGGALIVADPGLGRLHRFDAEGRRDKAWPHPSVTFSKPEFLALVASACNCGGSCGRGCGCGEEGGAGAPAPHLFVLDRGQVVTLDRQGLAVDAKPRALLPPALRMTRDGLVYDYPTEPGHDPLLIAGLKLTREGRLDGPNLPVIAMPRRTEVPRSGEITFDAFDSGLRGFAWDRIAFDLAMPANCSLVVKTLTTDAVIAPDRLALQADAGWSRPLTIAAGDLPEVLIQSGPGRFLWLRLSLIGDGATTPEIARIDLFAPRKSGLDRLPATFRQDPQSADFLGRFLSYFDTIFAELRAANRDVPALFDPRSVPEGQWLDWLGSWFDLGFLAAWDVQTRREMVAQAVETARERGTAAGLSRLIRWHLDLQAPWPMLIEHFRLGPDSPPLAHVPLPTSPEPHRVTVVLPRARVAPGDEAVLHKLMDRWLPAHVRADLVFIAPGLVIGCQSLLGIDTLLGGDAPEPVGDARLGIDFATRPPQPGLTLHSGMTIGESHVGRC